MAQIIDANMSLAVLPKEVVIKVSYGLSFSAHEKLTLSTGSPAMWFDEYIDILGAPQPLAFPSQQVSPHDGIVTRHRSFKEFRENLQKGVLPTSLWCRIRLVASPLSGAAAETNTVALPNTGVVRYVPLTRLVPAVGALVAAVAVVALLRRR